MQPQYSQTMHIFLIFLLLLGFLTVYGVSVTASTGGGLRLRLIHRDSIYSPFYPGNLTAYELLQRRVNYAKAHVQQMHSSARRGVVPDDLTPIVTHDNNFEYMVQTFVGSNQIFQNLLIDTGSDLIWVQCEPYQGSHFQQDLPHYIIGNSTTLSYVPCNKQPMCLDYYDCDTIHQRCLVKEKYGDGSLTIKGFLSTERFGFENDMGNTTIFDNINFGCIYTSDANGFKSTKIAGILGMGQNDQSLPSQLASNPYLDMHQFTYCFVPMDVSTVTFLKFGEDFTIGGTVQTLKFVENPPEFPSYYYINLTGITVNTDLLNIPESTFAIKGNDGGSIIDTGSTVTFLVNPAYDVLKNYIVNYFEQTPKTYFPVKGPLDLCYTPMDGPVKPLPSMVYHFGEEANLTADALNNVWVKYTINSQTSFCLGVIPDPRLTILGVNLMINKRFVYDLKQETLSFGFEKCENDE